MKDQAEIERKYGLSIQGHTLFETIFEVCSPLLSTTHVVSLETASKISVKQPVIQSHHMVQ